MNPYPPSIGPVKATNKCRSYNYIKSLGSSSVSSTCMEGSLVCTDTRLSPIISFLSAFISFLPLCRCPRAADNCGCPNTRAWKFKPGSSSTTCGCAASTARWSCGSEISAQGKRKPGQGILRKVGQGSSKPSFWPSWIFWDDEAWWKVQTLLMTWSTYPCFSFCEDSVTLYLMLCFRAFLLTSFEMPVVAVYNDFLWIFHIL